MITVSEIRNSKETADLVLLGEMHHGECAPHLTFQGAAVVATCDMVLRDTERQSANIWVAREDGEPIGYAVAYCSPFYFNFDCVAKLELWYVIPAKRKSWAAVKLVKAFEEWGRLNRSVQLYVGVARTEVDEARHIRKLFPKLRYQWCGSYYLKETSK
jgi:hypothetical protein